MKQQNVGNRKITIWMIPLILICGVLLSALISMDVSIRSAYERAKIVLNDSAYEQMDIFHAKLEGQFSVLQAFADYCVTADEDEAELQRLMGFIAAGGEFHHIGIIDPRTAVARVNTGESFSVKDRSYFTEAMSGKTAMDTIEKNRVDQMALVVLSVPVYRNDKIVAVVFGSYDTEKFSQLLTAGAYNRHSYSFVCDATGQLIVGSTSSAFLGTRDGASLNDTNMVAIFEQATLSSEFSLCQFIDNLRNGVGGAVAYDVAGNRRYAIYQPMGINDWFIFNVVDEVLIDQEVKASTGRNLAWIGIIVGFSLLALLFLLLREKQTRREDALAAEKLRCLAENDSLTGLLNRQSFLIQAQEMLNQAQSNQYALCYLDIDRFKIINDLFGHEQGDQLLCFVAERLRRITGGRGFCCRVFADYFAACVPNRPDIFQGLLQICAVDLKQYPLPCELSASMGIYIIDDPMLPMETMLDRAALARKAIKDNYNQYVAYYDDSMRNKLIAEQEILGLMNSAIENHQFILHLQPQYNHISGQIIGAEALVRWQHPDRGLLYPGAFVPILEHNGFIARLDEYVWEETCKLLRRWLDQGRIPMPLGVNVSRVDIYRSDLCGVIVGLTEKYDIPRTLLRLEITESAYVENPEQLINTVGKLQQAGFLIEMDDFGSGYSSLNTLKDVPVDMIKLDMKFLSGGDGQRRKTLILKNVIQMAKDLGLPVIAEGVETKEQADLLRSFDCSLVQGYYYAKPATIAAFEEKFFPA